MIAGYGKFLAVIARRSLQIRRIFVPRRWRRAGLSGSSHPDHGQELLAALPRFLGSGAMEPIHAVRFKRTLRAADHVPPSAGGSAARAREARDKVWVVR